MPRRLVKQAGPGLVACCLALCGCTVGPDYQAPSPVVPAAYSTGPSTGDHTTTQWWRAFDDQTLDDLVARALAGNLDLQQAAARVRQARESQAVTRAATLPSVNASSQAGYTRLSENTLPSALTSLGTGSSSGGGLGQPGEGFATYQFGFDASWEIDLFGGRRRADQAAQARTEGAVWSQHDAEVVLTAEVANTYEQYRGLQRRLQLTDDDLAAQRQLLALVEARAAGGLVTSLDVRRQQQAVDQLAAQRHDLAAQASGRVHALSVLVGAAPTSLESQLAGPPAGPPATIEVPPGLPSELLQRRPDLRAAERRLAAATADIGVATADLYPKISLTGAAQQASRSLSSLLDGDSLQANGAGKLSMPLLSGGARASVRLRRAQAQEAELAYRSDVLVALREVEDGLSRLQGDRRRVESLQAMASSADDAAQTTLIRYRNGLIAYSEVLTAHETALLARDALVQAQAAAAQDTIALFKALGGGWSERPISNQEEVTHGAGR